MQRELSRPTLEFLHKASPDSLPTRRGFDMKALDLADARLDARKRDAPEADDGLPRARRNKEEA